MDPFPGTPPDLWDRMAAYLRGIDASLGGRPKAILVVSGHWEAPRPTVNPAEHPSLLYDYSGFPEHTYRLEYPVSGSPALAARTRELLADRGLPSAEDSARGLDHGVFIPFKVMYPDADVPLVQLSLNRNRHAATHLAIGRALMPLRDEGVLIVGSGMSYHNLREIFVNRPESNQPSEDFDRWLRETVTESAPDVRAARLIDWQDAPGARASHPTPEHLLPLMVAVGAGGSDAGTRSYNDRLMGKAVSGFQLGQLVR
jgi:aromatic ring-opening dioxygenase catalytic subunit (LigB family)